MSARSQYSLTVVGPDSEVIGIVSLDGIDLNDRATWAWVGDEVSDTMGGTHRAACAALPEISAQATGREGRV